MRIPALALAALVFAPASGVHVEDVAMIATEHVKWKTKLETTGNGVRGEVGGAVCPSPLDTV